MINRRLLCWGVAVAGVLALPHAALAEVKLPSIFSDHMVVQREAMVPVWGWADPGETVTVTIAGQSKSVTADARGDWSVKLDQLKAAGPLTLTVKGKNTLTVEDILIGEVWLASGQSNMQMGVNGVTNAWKEKATAKFPQIRMFTVARRTAIMPQTNCLGEWIICSPETVGNFSATAYFFGRELHQTLQTPVGLINASWGGTPIEAWTSMAAQEDKAELAAVLSTWRQKTGVPFDEPKALAQYQKQMTVWTNVSEKAKAAGKKPPQQPKLPVAPRLQANHPANLFNGMIAPIIPYGIRGGIWYQGENNAHDDAAQLYALQLPLLIQDWRQRWNQGDFPFAWVQLPNFHRRTNDPAPRADWAVIRESMLRSLVVPHTGMAVAIDVGEPDNIHPRDKQTIGKRLSLWARAEVYGEKIPFSGPVLKRHKIAGSEVTLSFEHTEGGLVAKDSQLTGFTIADSDNKWFWAEARIVGNQVIVSSPDVKSPMAVRYAWANNPACSLYNGAGLPAAPFRTDFPDKL
jgi:sialate O-acetylesterase